MGAVECPTEYDFEVVYDIDFAALGTEGEFSEAEETPSIMLEASVTVVGTEVGAGDWSVDCSGTLSGALYGMEDWSDSEGDLFFSHIDDIMGYVVDWELFGVGANVEWEDDCMVNLPSMQLAIAHNDGSIHLMDGDGNWQSAFSSGTNETVEEDGANISRWEGLVQTQSITWTETY